MKHAEGSGLRARGSCPQPTAHSPQRLTAAEQLIVALDFTTLGQAVTTAGRLRGLARTVKVGSALFTACGPAAIRRLRALGFEVMLDLKFHDIPSTVELSCRAAAQHRVSMLTVHAAGGRAMLEAAVGGARAGAHRRGVAKPRVLAVTLLTSVAGADSTALTARVMRLAQDARQAGCDGVVASAQEAAALRRRFGAAFWIVCPGIRPAQAGAGDQQRIATPREALARGADALVIGRPITAAARPRAAAQQILREIEGDHAC